MPRGRKPGTAKPLLRARYDADHQALDKTYGEWAPLRRQLSDSFNEIEERSAILEQFALCTDPHRAHMLLDEYFGRISLSRRDFPGKEWWPRLMTFHGQVRLEETALLFLRTKRQLPTELAPYANLERLKEREAMEREHALVSDLEKWLLPPLPSHTEEPRALLEADCRLESCGEDPILHRLIVHLTLTRTRSGRKYRDLKEISEINFRATHERELYSSEDWRFLEWLMERYREDRSQRERICLEGAELLHWLCEWGQTSRLRFHKSRKPLIFQGRTARIRHQVDDLDGQLFLTHVVAAGARSSLPLTRVRFLAGSPRLVLCGEELLLLDDAPPRSLIQELVRMPILPISQISAKLLDRLRSHAASSKSRELLEKAPPPSPSRQAGKLIREMEAWLEPSPAPPGESGRSRWILGELVPDSSGSPLKRFEAGLSRTRQGKRRLPLDRILKEEELPEEARECLEWLSRHGAPSGSLPGRLGLQGLDLVHWLSRWSHLPCIEIKGALSRSRFLGQMAELRPRIEKLDEELCLTLELETPGSERTPFSQAQFLAGSPCLALAGGGFLVLRNPPPPELLSRLHQTQAVPLHKLTHRILVYLRKHAKGSGVQWEKLCICHTARPVFHLELLEDTVRLRLEAISGKDGTRWRWNGLEWSKIALPVAEKEPIGKERLPEFLDDERLDDAAEWLMGLDCFTPEPGLWIGDPNERFLENLSAAWPQRPRRAEFLGNVAFQRLFAKPRRLRPRLILKGSGIDWLSVSAEWEQEGMELTEADLQRLQASTDRFVRLPDSGWIELDTDALFEAHDTMAELGLEELKGEAQKVPLIHASHLDEEKLRQLGEGARMEALRRRLENFEGFPRPVPMPEGIQAVLRPYQQEGFNFLCHQALIGAGAILADDMGLGKTLQTLCWIKQQIDSLAGQGGARPFLVVCPASVLHNWKREAERFVPDLRVLLLESGEERHARRKEIPSHDLTITNYSIMRRDCEELMLHDFHAIVLDEAQYIKNPAAKVTRAVKLLRATHRLALTGTPMENRLLDLWSIVDFVQPGYLGTQSRFIEIYEPRKEGDPKQRQIARKHLSAKLRPILLRRLKSQVAKDLPDRTEERRDCDLTEPQRKLYLAELRRSRDRIFSAMKHKKMSEKKIHVLAALTRLRQICCHPRLVGSDSDSGKTGTLFELLESLMAEGQKVLLFSQFVEMLLILQEECGRLGIPTHLLTGKTKDRTERVRQFQESEVPSVFLLSLRAAGTGLNLTTASYVILYDPWWNPAVEAQAVDRTHRIGQTRTVNAYRLISPGTVEDKIWELQKRKARTISDVLGEEGFANSLTADDLEYLFSEDGLLPRNADPDPE